MNNTHAQRLSIVITDLFTTPLMRLRCYFNYRFVMCALLSMMILQYIKQDSIIYVRETSFYYYYYLSENDSHYFNIIFPHRHRILLKYHSL